MSKTITNLLMSMTMVIACFVPSAAAQTINGCADKVHGQLRRIVPPDACKNHEMPVNWSIQGPTGPQGETGEAGASGLSKVYATSADFGSLSTELVHSPPALIKQLNLPAGSYLVTAKISLVLTSTSNTSAACTLSKGPNVEHFGGPDFLDTGRARDPASSAVPTIGSLGDTERLIMLTRVLTLAAPGVAQLRCSASLDGEVFWKNLRLSAVQMNEVEIQ